MQVFIRSHFKPSGEKSSLCTPVPFGNLPLSDPPTPQNFRDPPWGGEGGSMDIFWNHTIRTVSRSWLTGIFLYEKFLAVRAKTNARIFEIYIRHVNNM